ncbi:MAG: Txe/YoeB family addiction module toxin [Rhodopila sp.]
MKVVFTDNGWAEYRWWCTNEPETLLRLNELIENVRRTPFKGIGKPEPLKGTLQGFWSRRITGEHRLVYDVSGSGEAQTVTIVMCRYHY